MVENLAVDLFLTFSHQPRTEAYTNIIQNLKKLRNLTRLQFTSDVHKVCRQYCVWNIAELFDLVFGSMKNRGLEIMRLDGCFYHVNETFDSNNIMIIQTLRELSGNIFALKGFQDFWLLLKPFFKNVHRLSRSICIDNHL